MRAVGVFLVCAGSLWWSLRACGRRRLVLELLEDLVRAVEYLQRELSLGQRPLPELLEQLSQQGGSAARAVFAHCREGLHREEPFSRIWPLALEQTALDGRQRRALEPLGWLLGRYDATGQGEALSRLHRVLEPMVERCRQDTARQVRLFSILGVTAGGFLSLTLI
ncbi:MAG: stage III sporulation protein AB [Oscillospiraceae bacterium]|nr:stage III sporulation protein AB [Oscillospiraceae bacterium]MBO5918008.1 stage III sporulation protein AB [Oscillospiraceae bacterium]